MTNQEQVSGDAVKGSGGAIALPTKHVTPWLCDVCEGEFPVEWMQPFKFNGEPRRACPTCAERIKTYINRFATTQHTGDKNR